MQEIGFFSKDVTSQVTVNNLPPTPTSSSSHSVLDSGTGGEQDESGKEIL